MKPLQALALIGLLCGCAHHAENTAFPAVYDSTEVELAKIPEAAAECVRQRARAGVGNYAAYARPLYGLDQIEIRITERPTGDAVAYLTTSRNGSGSHGRFSILKTATPDERKAILDLTSGC